MDVSVSSSSASRKEWHSHLPCARAANERRGRSVEKEEELKGVAQSKKEEEEKKEDGEVVVVEEEE